MNSYIIWQYIFHNCLSNVWRAFESHQESQVLVFTKWCDDGTGVLTFIVKLKCVVLHTNVKFSTKLVSRTLACTIHDYQQWTVLKSYVQLTWVADSAYSVVFLSKVFKWIPGTGWGIECTGLAFGSMLMCTFYVDKRQEFHQTSFYFPIALKASLHFDVHLDEWVLLWPQLHLSFHTWHPESLLQSIWVNLNQRVHLWLGC